MANQIDDTDLDEWYRTHDGSAADPGSAAIAIQARDELIRRLIDEVRRLRAQAGPPCELCGRPSSTMVKVLLGQRWSPRCDEHTQ
jgi:hypothetical protein